MTYFCNKTGCIMQIQSESESIPKAALDLVTRALDFEVCSPWIEF